MHEPRRAVSGNVREFMRGASPRRPLDKDGEPPDDGGMEARVQKLELIAEKTSERLGAIEKDVAVLLSRSDGFATKADLHQAIDAQTWKFVTWVTGMGAVLVAAVYFIARNVT